MRKMNSSLIKISQNFVEIECRERRRILKLVEAQTRKKAEDGALMEIRCRFEE
nr:hypothetical protein Iba_scaffold60734CG0010 [Ipomoea batatas]GMC88438.1 hypothetical protein Iba_scaffold64277CG0010 [Ipomoea batatas]